MIKIRCFSQEGISSKGKEFSEEEATLPTFSVSRTQGDEQCSMPSTQWVVPFCWLRKTETRAFDSIIKGNIFLKNESKSLTVSRSTPSHEVVPLTFPKPGLSRYCVRWKKPKQNNPFWNAVPYSVFLFRGMSVIQKMSDLTVKTNSHSMWL